MRLWPIAVPADAPGVAQGIKNPLHYGIPARLKRARKQTGIAVSAVATRAGLSQETARQIEAGAVPRLDVVEALARVLQMSPGWLAFGPKQVPVTKEAPADVGAQHRGIGARLRAAREQAGLNKAELGRAAGVSGTAVLNIEDARSVPSVATAEQLADALGVSPAWLAFGEGVGPGE